MTRQAHERLNPRAASSSGTCSTANHHGGKRRRAVPLHLNEPAVTLRVGPLEPIERGVDLATSARTPPQSGKPSSPRDSPLSSRSAASDSDLVVHGVMDDRQCPETGSLVLLARGLGQRFFCGGFVRAGSSRARHAPQLSAVRVPAPCETRPPIPPGGCASWKLPEIAVGMCAQRILLQRTASQLESLLHAT